MGVTPIIFFLFGAYFDDFNKKNECRRHFFKVGKERPLFKTLWC